MSEHDFRVRISEDGPYELVGSPPLVRTAQVETEFGEPIGWEEPTPIDGTRRDRPLPVRRVEPQAVLRRVARDERVRRHGGGRPPPDGRAREGAARP